MSDTTETKNKPAEAAPPAEAPSGGGFKAWLPLIVTVVLMPVMAYVTTTFVLVPKLQVAARGAVAPAHGEEEEGEAASEEHVAGSETTESHGGKAKGTNARTLSPCAAVVSKRPVTRMKPPKAVFLSRQRKESALS